MAVYLDIIWLLNFMFDSLLLYLTAIILRREFRYWRLIAGGMVGSCIILFIVTPFSVYAGHPVVKLLFSIFMVLTAFGYKRFKYFINGLLCFYLITFLVGGFLIGIHYFIRFDMNLSSSLFMASIKGFGDPVSWLFVLIGFPLAWHFSKSNFEKIEVAKIQHNQLVALDVCLAGHTYRFKGLVDSGNQLYDPISKMPVMFVSVHKIVEKLPKALQEIALHPDEVLTGEQRMAPEWENRMRIIPLKVVGQEHQLVIAVKPDKLTLYQNDQAIQVEKGLVSLTMQQLSSDDAFQCIIHPKMLQSNNKVISA